MPDSLRHEDPSVNGVAPVTKVLVVEDHATVRRAAVRALSRHGFRCDEAEDGQQGAERLRETKYDVLLTDLAMPRMNGHALCVQALGMPNRPAIVVLTGVIEKRLAADLKTRGVDRVLTKPQRFKEVAAAVSELLAERNVDGGRPEPQSPRPRRSNAVGPEADAAEPFAGPNADEDDRPSTAATPPPAGTPVAILVNAPERAAEICGALADRELRGVRLSGADELHRIMQTEEIEFVLLEQRLEGFVSGDEIVRRLSDRFPCPQIVLLEAGGTAGGSATGDVPANAVRMADDAPIERIAARIAALARNAAGDTFGIPPRAREIAAKTPTAPAAPQFLGLLARHLRTPPEECNVAEVVDDISSDPAAATELLRLVNSAHLGLRRRVNRLSDAVKLLGASRAVSLTFAVCQKRLAAGLKEPWAVELHAWYHRRCLLIACAAREALRREEPALAEDAFALGLLQELGIVLIAGRYGESYAQSILAAVKRPRAADLAMLEARAVRTNHALVTGAALLAWGFPKPVVQLALSHHESTLPAASSAAERRLHAAMQIGESVADLLDNRSADRLGRYQTLLKTSGLAPGQHPRELLAETAAAAEDYLSILSLPMPQDESLVDTLQSLTETAFTSAVAAGGAPLEAVAATAA